LGSTLLISKLITENGTRYFSYKTTGFNVGIVGDLKLQEYIHLRFEPGLYYTKRDLNYPGSQTTVELQINYEQLTFISFILKFSALRTNIRPYLVGVSATLNLSSNSKSDDNANRNLE
jgi:hypothetical protein